MFQAAKSLEAEEIAASVRGTRQQHEDSPYHPNFRPETKTVLGEEAEKVADTAREPTGDDEWDAVELAETDPMREPFDDAFVADFLKGT